LRICVFAYLRICVFAYLRICVFAYLRICVFVHLCICVFVHLCICVFVHLCISLFSILLFSVYPYIKIQARKEKRNAAKKNAGVKKRPQLQRRANASAWPLRIMTVAFMRWTSSAGNATQNEGAKNRRMSNLWRVAARRSWWSSDRGWRKTWNGARISQPQRDLR
jgi:hypothetical protein